ncbi:unnamed protein product [Mytilus coruscus]|uniref:B box-type domain-containing protein n=1 Tax=Mytilus coruscus TaxID=42192 RepID=A0A6J7ZY40_MYTCO|nr:unnamed protein product [Mytilus coruscus]
MSKKHSFISGPNINPEGNQYCNEHDENFIYYCMECETPICKMCVIENHKKHDLSEITTLTDIYKAEVERQITMKLDKLKRNIMAIDQGTNACQCDFNAVIHSMRKEGILSVRGKHATKLQTLQSIGNAFKTVFDKAEEQHKIYQDTAQTTETSKLLLKLKQIKLQIADEEVKQLPGMPSVNYVINRAPTGELEKLVGGLTFGETVRREEKKLRHNKKMLADVSDTNFEDHVLGHVGRICPFCFNLLENCTDEDFQRHVNQHLDQTKTVVTQKDQ